MQSWDMAFKDTPNCDYVVGLVGGRHNADIYIVDRVKGQWSFSETCRQVERLSQKYPERTHHFDRGNGQRPGHHDHVPEARSGLIGVQPQGGKVARAQAVQPLVEAGNLYLPNPRPLGMPMPERAWVEDFVHQLITFPHGAHDDDVDAFTQLVVRLRRPIVSCVW